jgi:hypothetical protein
MNQSVVKSVPGKKEEVNINIAKIFAANLFLNPSSIESIAFYWFIQYSDPSHSIFDRFPSLIEGILENDIRLTFISWNGMASIRNIEEEYVIIMKIIGTEKHGLPVQYFAHQKNYPLLYTISHLLDPDNKFFRQIDSNTIEGELVIHLYEYNIHLKEMFDPAFLIMSCYIQLVNFLVNKSKLEPNQKMKIIKDSIKILKEDDYYNDNPFNTNNTIKKEIRCIRKDDNEKMKYLRQYMIKIKDILSGLNLKECHRKLTIEWQKMITVKYREYKSIMLSIGVTTK